MTAAMNGHKVTERTVRLSGGEIQTPPAERETAAESPKTLHSPITKSDDRSAPGRGLKGRIWDWAAMTSPLGERAPAIRRIREYAQHGPWTARQDGPVRFLGVAFCWTVTIPAVIALRVAEWPFLRPSRFIFTAITVKCLSELPFVEAFVDTVIKPGVERALWLFL